jgi:hypothetical protein
LCGEKAAAYVSDIRSGFEPDLEPGLRRIAQMMTRSAQDNSDEDEGAALPGLRATHGKSVGNSMLLGLRC